MDEPNSNGSRTVTGVTPKFYIKDEGTTYTTGEEYNGLWSAGPRTAPTGYADIGHWRMMERKGRVLFNARSRGNNDLITNGIFWSTDTINPYIQFKLPEGNPLPRPSANHYIMVGSGSGFNENTQWDQFVSSPGLNGLMSVGGQRKLRYHFDIWADFSKPPQEDGDIQTLFYIHQGGISENGQRALRFCVEKVGGQLYLSMYITDGTTGFSPVRSSSAGDAIYNSGPTQSGGLHRVEFLLDVDVQFLGDPIFSSPSIESPEGFYVDGKQHMVDSGDTSLWTDQTINGELNPFIGCEIVETGVTVQADKVQENPAFHNHFLGRIYSTQMNSIGPSGTITAKRINTLYSLRFDIPRGPSYIDLSDKFEYNGRNLLKEISDIEQVVDNEKGSFYVTVQNLKAKN